MQPFLRAALWQGEFNRLVRYAEVDVDEPPPVRAAMAFEPELAAVRGRLLMLLLVLVLAMAMAGLTSLTACCSYGGQKQLLLSLLMIVIVAVVVTTVRPRQQQWVRKHMIYCTAFCSHHKLQHQ